MVKIFEKKCAACPGTVMGPRTDGKARGQWLGHDICLKCQKAESEKIATLTVGERFQIPRDQHGKPVLEYDRERRQHIDGMLQWFEVVSIADGRVEIKPVWP